MMKARRRRRHGYSCQRDARPVPNEEPGKDGAMFRDCRDRFVNKVWVYGAESGWTNRRKEIDGSKTKPVWHWVRVRQECLLVGYLRVTRVVTGGYHLSLGRYSKWEESGLS
jgi:hypothetical protein